MKESKVMADVYRGSLCTIGAAVSRGSNEGCFRRHYPHGKLPCVITTSFNNQHIDADYLLDNTPTSASTHEEALDKYPLFARGWVFQERVLSPRMLNFGDYVTWNCKMKVASEKYPKGYSVVPATNTLPTSISNLESNDISVLWKAAVTIYSSLQLTFPSDKLVAISAVARHLHNSSISGTYIAGLVSK